MQTILTILQVFLSLGLIGLVLIQHGRGADAGAAFGAGASGTVFGARGSGSFLSRATGVLAALFFLTSMALAYYAAKGGKPAGLMDSANGMRVKVETPAPVAIGKPVPAPSEVPVVPAAAPTATTDVPAIPSAPMKADTVPGPGAADLPPIPTPKAAAGGAAQGQDQGPVANPAPASPAQ